MTAPTLPDFTFLELDRKSPEILLVTLNRPSVMNALNAAMVDEIRRLLAALTSDPCRVLVLTGAGDQAFSAGADLAEMLAMTEHDSRASLASGVALTREIEHSSAIVIAALNGTALGGGFEIALACDLRTSRRDAKLGLPETTVGIFPGWGGTVRLPRLVTGGIAAEMILTGRPIDGNRAAELGLVNAVGDDAVALALILAERVLRGAPIAQQQAKLVMRRSVDMSVDDGLSFENEAWMRTHFSADRREGHQAFLDHRRPSWHGQ